MQRVREQKSDLRAYESSVSISLFVRSPLALVVLYRALKSSLGRFCHVRIIFVYAKSAVN